MAETVYAWMGLKNAQQSKQTAQRSISAVKHSYRTHCPFYARSLYHASCCKHTCTTITRCLTRASLWPHTLDIFATIVNDAFNIHFVFRYATLLMTDYYYLGCFRDDWNPRTMTLGASTLDMTAEVWMHATDGPLGRQNAPRFMLSSFTLQTGFGLR